MPALTSNDIQVLQALFDAESSPSSSANTVTINPSLQPLPERLQIAQEKYESLSARERAIIASLQPSPEHPNSSPDKHTVENSITELAVLIEEEPMYPSVYVNRAQALRMLVDDESESNESPFTDPAKKTTLSSLFADLAHAITLCTPPSATHAVSPIQARILSDAHTHRGYLLLKASHSSKPRKSTPGSEVGDSGFRQVWELEPEQLEDMASQDFFLGGKYGNSVARELSVRTNPFAKMCGAIVRGAIKEEITASV